MALELSPLSNAVERLREGLTRYQSNIADTQIRDGLVQRFEFIYELSHKMLKRYLEASAANPTEFDNADFQYLIRAGNEQNLLLNSWPQWRKFRDMRAKTSHTYNEEIALAVVSIIPDFLAEAEYLLDKLQQRQAK